MSHVHSIYIGIEIKCKLRDATVIRSGIDYRSVAIMDRQEDIRYRRSTIILHGDMNINTMCPNFASDGPWGETNPAK